MEFTGFNKIARLNRECVITEKLDGSNASLIIVPKSSIPEIEYWKSELIVDDFIIRAGSRTRFIQPENDNFGFAKWVHSNAEELVKLGEGQHFGEWMGQGIQRNYGLKEKRFYLFNTSKWSDDTIRPKCCYVVPVLYTGLFDTNIIKNIIEKLKKDGSVAISEFMKPEGIVVYHAASKQMFKITCENDEKPKSLESSVL
jgi:hypothetical protein